MKIFAIIIALLLAACATQNPQSQTANSEEIPKVKNSTIYVQVLTPEGVEVFSDYATTIREEAYKHYATMGLSQAPSLADADMNVVFRANSKALRSAVKMKLDKTKVTDGKVGEGKNIWVVVKNDLGQELANPIADTIKSETYEQLQSQGYTRANSANEADVTVSVFTNDQTLRAAVRKALANQPLESKKQ
jgi:hypothetical protein